MSIAKQADIGLFGQLKRKDGIYKRVRKDEERQMSIRWRIDYSDDACVLLTTHIDADDVNLSWEEWDDIKYDSSRTEQIKEHLENLFKHNLAWSLEEIKDIGTAYDGDLGYTIQNKVKEGWYKPVPEWDEKLDEDE